MSEETFCINHPQTSTRVRCSNCDSPICPKCMIQTPVGQKCPSCGRVKFKRPGGARRYGAAVAGLLTAAALEAALLSLPLGLFAILVHLVVGYVTGTVVLKISGPGYGIGSTAAIATGCGMAMGLLILGFPLRALFTFGFLISAAIAAYVASYRASH